MDAETLSVLLADVKTNLPVTWDDASTDARLSQLIQLGAAYLDDKRGAPADYTVPGYPRQLLFEYVRYARDEALDVFEANYLSMILAMRHERMVSEYAATQAAEQADP